jgi:CRP-like cAMP-binding protein
MLKPSNQLLAALPPKELELIRPDLVDLDLPVGQVLFNPGDIFRDVYFPTTAVISMRIVMRDGQSVEVGSVGHEGMLGGVRLYYDDDEAFAYAICDVSGHVQKIAAEVFWARVKALPGLRHVVHHYTHAAFVEVFQSVACCKAHTLPQRFARAMLTKQDRARTQTLSMTGAQVAEMLSISPPGASALLAQLTQDRLIDYTNDVVQIRNRAGLEAMACECYERVQIELKKIQVKRESRQP